MLQVLHTAEPSLELSTVLQLHRMLITHMYSYIMFL